MGGVYKESELVKGLYVKMSKEEIVGHLEALRKERDDILEELMDTINQATRQGGIDYVLDPMGLSAYEDALYLLHKLGKVEPIPPHNYQYRMTWDDACIDLTKLDKGKTATDYKEPVDELEALRKERDDILEELMDTVNQATRQGGVRDYVLDPMGLSAYEGALELLHRLGKVEPIPPHNYQYRIAGLRRKVSDEWT
jgi:uncharacterized protein YjgD (DUF1641 family)